MKSIGRLLGVVLAVLCCRPAQLAAAAEDTVSEDAPIDLWAALQDLPPELAEALPEDLRLLLEEMEPGAWQTLLTVSTALGYRDNVGLSSVVPVADSFGQARLEGLAMRQPLNGWEWLAIVDGQSRWYADNPVTEDEHFWFGRGQVRWSPWSPLKFTAAVQGFWQDRVIDLTEGIGARTVAALQVWGGEGSFGTRVDFWGGFGVDATLVATRLDYRGVGEDYEALRYQGEFFWTAGEWLTLAVGGQAADRDYDFRRETTKGGRLLDDTLLAYGQETEYARLRLNWTRGGDWELELKGSRFENRDGASGFYDYDRERWSGALVWELARWEIRGEWEEQDVAYTLQTVGAGINPDARLQEDRSWMAEVHYRWGDHWEVFGEILVDRSLSNGVDASYRDRTVVVGAAYTF